MSNAIRQSRLNHWTKQRWKKSKIPKFKIAFAVSNVIASTIYFNKQQTDALI